MPEAESLPHTVLRAGVDEAQTRRLLTVLIRLAERHPEVADLLSGRVYPRDGKQRGLMTSVSSDVDLSRVEAATPDHSATLVHVAARLCDHSLSRTRALLGEAHDPFREVDSRSGGADNTPARIRSAPREGMAEHARNYARYAARALDAGYADVAVEMAKKAYFIQRELTSHGDYRRALADSLMTLSQSMVGLGVDTSAARYAPSAIQLYQELASTGRLGLHDRARLSEAQSTVEVTAGSPYDAVYHAEDTVVSYRRLTHGNNEEYLPRLADALLVLADRHAWLRQLDEAADEAVTLHRRIRGPWRGSNTVGLASAFVRRAEIQAARGMTEDALATCEEGLRLLESDDLDVRAGGPPACRLRVIAAGSQDPVVGVRFARLAATTAQELSELDRISHELLLAQALLALYECGPSCARC